MEYETKMVKVVPWIIKKLFWHCKVNCDIKMFWSCKSSNSLRRKINYKQTLLKERAHQTGYYKGIQPKEASVKKAGQHLVERRNEVTKACQEKERELFGVFTYQHRPWLTIRDEKLWNKWPDEP